MSKIVVIDPPGGWRYGFPKEFTLLDRDVGDPQMNDWLLENGYPQKEIDVFKGRVPCRFWEEEEK